MIEIPKMMSLDDAVALLKGAGIDLGKEFLRRRIISGELRGKKLGRGWRVTESDLLAFVGKSDAPEQPQPALRERHTTGHKDNGLIVEGINYTALMKHLNGNKKRR